MVVALLFSCPYSYNNNNLVILFWFHSICSMLVCCWPCPLHARSWLPPSCASILLCPPITPWRLWTRASFGLPCFALSEDVTGKKAMETRMPWPSTSWMNTTKICSPLPNACWGGMPQMPAWAFTRRPSRASAAAKPQWLDVPLTEVLWRHTRTPWRERMWSRSSASAVPPVSPTLLSWPRRARATSNGTNHCNARTPSCLS